MQHRTSSISRLRLILAIAVLASYLPSVSWAQDSISLTSVTHTYLPSGKVQIDVDADGSFERPRMFRTTGPDRLVIDFFGLDQQIENPVIEVGRGAVENLLVAEDDKRSRIVVNLIAPASFETIYRLSLIHI